MISSLKKEKKLYFLMIFIIFFLGFINNTYAEETKKKVLRIASDQMFHDMFSKFIIAVGKQINIIKIRENNTEELTMIFEEKCLKSDIFTKKNLAKYESDIIIANREMNEYEASICDKKIKKIKIGYYAFLITNSIEKNLNKNISNNILDITSIDFFIAIMKYSFSEYIFNYALNDKIKWSEVNRFLPDKNIKIYGPKTNSSFFFFFDENIISPICYKQESLFMKFGPDFKEIMKICKNFKLDSIYIEDVDDFRISLDKIMFDNESFFILPFYIVNKLKIDNKSFEEREILIHNFDGVEPSVENIKSLHYKFSWPIYIYIDNESIKNNNEINDLISSINFDINSKNGILEEYGLIK